jgi:hypothetical protein
VASVEIGNYYQEVQKIINTNLRPQFFFCLGKMEKKFKGMTQRWAVEYKLIK